MSRKLPIFYSALLLTGVNLLLRFVSTAFSVYLSGRIGASGIGLLQLVMSVGMLATTAGVAGVRTASMYLTAEELGRKKPETVIWVLSGCCVYSLLIGGGVSLLLRFFAPFIARHWIADPQTEDAIRLFSCFLPVSCLCGVMVGYFTAAGRIGTLAAVEVAEQLCTMVITIGLLSFWAGSDPQRACMAVIAGSGIGACLTLGCLTLLRAREKAPTGPRIPVTRRLLNTAVPLALADDLKSGISTAENLMVPKRLALNPHVTDPLASFGRVCGMVFPVIMFPAAIVFGLAELLIPELARCAAAGSKQRILYLSRRSLKASLLYGCLLGGLIYLSAEGLCLRLYRSREASGFMRLYALLIPMLYCDAITDAMTKGLGQQKACVRYNILTSSMDVVFLYLLLPRFGMMGYFWSFFVTHLVNFLLSLRRLIKITGRIVSIRTFLQALFATGFSVLAAAMLPSSALRLPCFLLLFGAASVLAGAFSKEDILWLKGLARPTVKQKNRP